MYGSVNSDFESGLGFPVQFFFDFGSVNGIAKIVSQTVGDVLDQFLGMPLGAPQILVGNGDELVDNIYVFDLVVPADVVGGSQFTFLENQINGTCMVFDIKPISYVLAVAINGQWFFLNDVLNE